MGDEAMAKVSGSKALGSIRLSKDETARRLFSSWEAKSAPAIFNPYTSCKWANLTNTTTQLPAAIAALNGATTEYRSV